MTSFTATRAVAHTATMRYLAEWITSEGTQDPGDFDPERCVYQTRPYTSRDFAERSARAEAANGPCGDWWRVTEQYQDRDNRWQDVRRWTCGELVT